MRRPQTHTNTHSEVLTKARGDKVQFTIQEFVKYKRKYCGAQDVNIGMDQDMSYHTL